MISVLMLYGPPVDRPAFDAYFTSTHRGLLNGLPDVTQVVVHRVHGAITGASPFHLVVELRYPSPGRMEQSLNSSQGQLVASDFQHFASGGVTILCCDVVGLHPRILTPTERRPPGVEPATHATMGT